MTEWDREKRAAFFKARQEPGEDLAKYWASKTPPTPEQFKAQTEALNKPRAPRSRISWFGYDIRWMELFTNADLERHMHDVEDLAHSMGLEVKRYGNTIDITGY